MAKKSANFAATTYPLPPGAGGSGGGGINATELQGVPIEPTAPIQGAVPVYDSPPNAYDIRQLTSDDIAPGFTVSLHLTGSSQVELGQTVVTPAFTATYTRTPTSSILTDNQGNLPKDVTLTPNAFSSDNTYIFTTISTVNFTLTASPAGGPVRTGNASITWLARYYYGVGPAGSSSAAFIQTLGNSFLASSRNTTFTVTAGSTEKIYVAYPASFGAATFTIGGFTGGFLSPSTVSVTNAFGVTISYFLYESLNTNLGTTTVQVS